MNKYKSYLLNMKPLRYIRQLQHIIKIFLISFRLLGITKTFSFFNNNVKTIQLKGINFYLRNKNFKNRTVDFCMLIECIILNEYVSEKKFDIKEQDVVVDIGAHIGSFSIYAAKKAKQGRVFAFEPCPDNNDMLKKNMKLNNLKNLVISNKAVGGKTGKIKIYINPSNLAENGAYFKSKSFVVCGVTTLNEIFKKNKIDRINCLKIDCEGSEYEILLNSPKEVLSRIDKIVLEYHEPFYFGIKGYTKDDLIMFLKECGFFIQIKKTKFYQGIMMCYRE